MELEALYEIIATYESFNLTLWNIYIAVILGVLAYAIGSNRGQKTAARLLLAICFSVFALSNYSYLSRNQHLINALAKEAAIQIKTGKYVSQETIAAVSTWADRQPSDIRKLHVPIDISVVLLLLISPTILRKIRSDKE